MRQVWKQLSSSQRRILLISSVSIPILLAGLLALQYVSLVKLQKNSSSAQKLTRLLFLQTVAAKAGDEFLYRAQQLLNIPLAESSTGQVKQIETHFGEKNWRGARLLFVAFFKSRKETQILFFDPALNSLQPHPEWPEMRKLEPVLAQWELLGASQQPADPARVRVNEIDAEDRILLVPIIDKSSRVVGVTGMFADVAFFRNEFVPLIVRAYLPKYGSAQDRIILTLRDPYNQLMFSSDRSTSRDDEASVLLPQVFTDWRLGLQSQTVTPEQAAGRSFALNMALAFVILALLCAAMGLILRGTIHEMKLSQMKSDFLSNVSHELRTPLSSIRVFAEFLRLGWIDEPERIRETGERIETESRRLTQLVDNILDFSRIESARKEYRFEKTNLDEVIRDALRIVDAPAQQAGFNITYENLNERTSECAMDRDAIMRVLVNLIDNAMKYSRDSKHILVELGHAGEFATVAVIDRGIGIPREAQQRVFEKFFRNGSSLVHDVKGSGLGLTIVKHIVDAHGGRITVESEPGKGSTFTIYLPLNNGIHTRQTQSEFTDNSK